MDQRKLSVFQVHTQLKKSEFLGAKLNTSKTWRSISVTFGVFLVILGSLTAVAVDTNPADLIDDNLNVALAPAGDMFFPDTGAEITETMAEMNFDTGTVASFTSNGVQAVLLSDNTSTRRIGNGSGTLALNNALVWGGAGGTGRYAQPGSTEASNYTLRFFNDQGNAYTQRYVGFWWSAGNGTNNLQLLDATGAVISGFTTFTTASVLRTIFPNNANGTVNTNGANLCPGTRPTAAQITANSGLAYCGNPTLNANGSFRFDYVNEPFAFIHFRYADGFGGIKMWGGGFEFDNLTFSETNPAGAVGEVAIGGGLNTTCDGVGALGNGGFETLPTVTENTDLSFTGVGRWHGYNGTNNNNPRFYLFLNPSGSATFALNSWLVTTNTRIEIQRAVAGFELTATDQTPDTRGVNPSEGSFFAELNADVAGTLYQDIATIPGSTLRWSLDHRGRRTGTQVDTMSLRIGPAGGTLALQTPTTRPANSGSGSNMEDARGSTATQTGGGTTGGWGTYRGSYTVPAGQTNTRFSFEGSGTSSQGNLLDNIVFSPTLACPDETSVIVNRSAVTFSPIANDFRPNADNTLTIVSTTGTGTATVNGTNLQLSSTTVGSFTVRYRLTNSFGDTSQANVVVNVLSESTPRLPDVVLVDPRMSRVDFPQASFENATNLLVCVQESDSGGSILASPTVSFDVASKNATDVNGIGSATINGDRTSTLLIRHTRQNVLDTFNFSEGLRVYLTSGSFNSTRYVRVRTLPVATSTTAVTVATCADAAASASKTIEIRPLGLTKTLRKGTIQLKN